MELHDSSPALISFVKLIDLRRLTSYRDTFRLLFAFIEEKTGHPPSYLDINDVDAPTVLAFLDHLEANRGNCPRSRNVRLSAIRSFFRFASVRDVDHLAVIDRVLAIPNKRASRPVLVFLTRSEVDAILTAPNRETWIGSRDHALLLTMYNTGARASELLGLKCGQVSFGSPTMIHLHGKGRKDRTVPLWPQTSRVLHKWFEVLHGDESSIAFPSNRSGTLSADALDDLLQRAVRRAALKHPELNQKRITPHTIRHSTALHLLQSGVDIAVIALWLGHESIETTHGYIEADLELKERALSKLAPAAGKVTRFKPGDALLGFLSSL